MEFEKELNKTLTILQDIRLNDEINRTLKVLQKIKDKEGFEKDLERTIDALRKGVH